MCCSNICIEFLLVLVHCMPQGQSFQSISWQVRVETTFCCFAKLTSDWNEALHQNICAKHLKISSLANCRVLVIFKVAPFKSYGTEWQFSTFQQVEVRIKCPWVVFRLFLNLNDFESKYSTLGKSFIACVRLKRDFKDSLGLRTKNGYQIRPCE